MPEFDGEIVADYKPKPCFYYPQCEIEGTVENLNYVEPVKLKKVSPNRNAK
jgi:hypothetical protein